MLNYEINMYENIAFPRKMKEDFCGKLYSYKLKTSVSKLLLKNILSEMLFNDNMLNNKEYFMFNIFMCICSFDIQRCCHDIGTQILLKQEYTKYNQNKIVELIILIGKVI